jgi:hypothetical protein
MTEMMMMRMMMMMIHVALFTQQVISCKPVVPRLCCTDPKGSANSSQGICQYISGIAASKSTYFSVIQLKE